MERTYMHEDDITRNDILREVRNVEQLHNYPNDGWKHNGNDTTLNQLAELWAEQENENQPEDRGTFPFWLQTHIDDNIVEEPENRLYGVTILTTTRQYVRFSAPEGMDVETAKDWFDEHRDVDGVVVYEGSGDVADEELYMDGE